MHQGWPATTARRATSLAQDRVGKGGRCRHYHRGAAAAAAECAAAAGIDVASTAQVFGHRSDAATAADLMGYYFKEDSDRSRIQKQLCHRDPTGVLGCLPDYLTNETVNNNATLGTTLSSKEFLRIVSGSPAVSAVGLGSVYGTDSFSGAVNPADLHAVDSDFTPTCRADKVQILGMPRYRSSHGGVTLFDLQVAFRNDGNWQKREKRPLPADLAKQSSPLIPRRSARRRARKPTA